MVRSFFAALLLGVTLLAPAAAQNAAPADGGLGGIKNANIFEVKPDANELQGYAEQTNGQRAKVQPGNNAPMWHTAHSEIGRAACRGEWVMKVYIWVLAVSRNKTQKTKNTK